NGETAGDIGPGVLIGRPAMDPCGAADIVDVDPTTEDIDDPDGVPAHARGPGRQDQHAQECVDPRCRRGESASPQGGASGGGGWGVGGSARLVSLATAAPLCGERWHPSFGAVGGSVLVGLGLERCDD